uniref:Uncharacterized protein n=1 Tax=Anopheles stephensi TaxID=30069 RepID=A0A182XYF5_ANOST
MFESAIHQNVSLHNARKLYFLKTNLSGEAAALISHLKIEDGNYQPALEKLKHRYDKPLEAAVKHPASTKTSAMIRALDAMKQEGRDSWLIHILAEKLDLNTKQLWCLKQAEEGEGVMKLETFLKFLDVQSSALFMTTQEKPTATSVRTERSRVLAIGSSENCGKVCGICQDAHTASNRTKFKSMTIDERICAVKINGTLLQLFA